MHSSAIHFQLDTLLLHSPGNLQAVKDGAKFLLSSTDSETARRGSSRDKACKPVMCLCSSYDRLHTKPAEEARLDVCFAFRKLLKQPLCTHVCSQHAYANTCTRTYTLTSACANTHKHTYIHTPYTTICTAYTHALTHIYTH